MNFPPDIPPLPPGPHAVAVSGGADSVALLLLLVRHQAHVRSHVVHLNHETRGIQSDEDASFVASLANRFGLPCTIARRSDLEPAMSNLPTNPSARYRAVRLALYRSTCQSHQLEGVLLAHHADDQAETVLHRLLRGSGVGGLAGMSPRSIVGDVTLLRPLLGVRRQALRDYLAASNEPWREDPSNASDDYLRNRIRKLLAARPDLTPALLDVAADAASLRDWTHSTAPTLDAAFRTGELHSLPAVLARESVRRWLTSHGIPAADLEPPVLDRVLRLAADAASPPTVNLPTNRTARRRSGSIWLDAS